jgi:hypothetical protein
LRVVLWDEPDDAIELKESRPPRFMALRPCWIWLDISGMCLSSRCGQHMKTVLLKHLICNAVGVVLVVLFTFEAQAQAALEAQADSSRRLDRPV